MEQIVCCVDYMISYESSDAEAAIFQNYIFAQLYEDLQELNVNLIMSFPTFQPIIFLHLLTELFFNEFIKLYDVFPPPEVNSFAFTMLLSFSYSQTSC